MQKVVGLLLVLIIAFLSIRCEVDDICTETVLTPRLNIKFYSKDEPDTGLSVEKLSVWAKDKDSLYKNQKVDSILLPLNPFATQTTYLLSKDNLIDTLRIAYAVKPKFLSRSCGYIYNFTLNDLPKTTTHWLNKIELVEQPQTVNNETTTDVKICH